MEGPIFKANQSHPKGLGDEVEGKSVEIPQGRYKNLWNIHGMVDNGK
jgi:hypothetical protein